MELVAASRQKEVEIDDQNVRVEDLQELSALQLGMVGGGLGIATLF